MSGSYLGGHSVVRLPRPKGETPKDAKRAYWARVKQGPPSELLATKMPDPADATNQTRLRRHMRGASSEAKRQARWRQEQVKREQAKREQRTK